VAAAEAGGFEHEDAHLTRTRKTFTRAGWRIVSKELLDMLDRLDRLADEDAERLEEEPGVETIDATVVMMMFEARAPAAFGSDAPASVRHDELQDIAPT
jgi:hypothetical protein